MKFQYSRQHLSQQDRVIQRALEIVPGLLSWSIIIGMILLSFLQPLVAAAVMVAFVLYWVLRLLYMNVFLLLSYLRLALEKTTDWMTLTEGMDNIDALLGEISQRKTSGIRKRLAARVRQEQLIRLKKSGHFPPLSREIVHLVILPVLKETREIVEPSIHSLAGGMYPPKRVLVVIALEERASDQVKRDIEAIQKKYQASFMDFLIVTHPIGMEGESRVKGANVSWAAKHAAEYFQRRGIADEHVIVSCFDADTIAGQEYLACLTYYFMITPSRLRSSYQPIPVYYNNLWDVPSFARIIDIGTSFFQLVEATNPEKLVTFSSHSMSFQALRDVGYWPVDMISDDSAIFWKSFIHYDGRYEVVPIYTTVSMDIASGRNVWQTFLNIYRQKRRWAWGVENIPIVMRAFMKAKEISLYKKLVLGVRLFDAFISWATWAFLLAFISWLPTIFAGREFASSTMYYMAPRIKGIIFSLSSVGVLVCMLISLSLLSMRNVRQSFAKMVLHMVEWLIIPAVVLILSAIPALDAQTRLMFGKYMEFKITEKFRE